MSNVSSPVDLLLEKHNLCFLLQISLDQLSDQEVVEFVNRTYTKILNDTTDWERTMPSRRPSTAKDPLLPIPAYATGICISGEAQIRIL